MIGDSITLGNDWHQFDAINRAVGGATTENLVKWLPILLHGIHPKLAVVMVGINDLTHGRTIDQAKRDYSTLLDQLSLLNVRVIVESVIYCSGECSDHWLDIEELNHYLRFKPRITFLDLNPYLAPLGGVEPRFTTDGIHLTPEAYDVWAARLELILGGYDGKR